MAAVAPGQTLGPTAPWDETPAQSTLGPSLWAPPARPNPASLLGDAVSLFARASDVQGGAVTNGAATADASGGEEHKGFSVALNIMLLLTVITLVPSVMVMTTCFVRILIVLALLRQAIGTQAIPPAQVVTGLALFLTAMVMAPTIDRVWDEAVVPYNNGEISDYGELWDKAKQPLRDYMFDQIEATGNWSSVYMLLNYRGVDTSDPSEMTRADVDMTVLVPAYMLSELKVGFLMGFRVYLPFLVIDMVIASILISMSMMMLPPVLISLPFKLLLFVLVDGWTLVVGSLLESFVQDGTSERTSAQAAMLPLLLIPVAVRGARARARVPQGQIEVPRLGKRRPRLRLGLHRIGEGR
ncbi:MAG: flagellar type III secretion system pore protein FliP [Phycisphaeraceae bacterium]|nr:MAG: flagellar type III secretion system pore protein FliP [Phycisphaeraceae bacterium]